ncbi:hypothetical protein U1Q18_013888 [Sarracenia purpurea var. burkii]
MCRVIWSLKLSALRSLKMMGTRLVADSSTSKISGNKHKRASGASKNKITGGLKPCGSKFAKHKRGRQDSGATDHIARHRFRFVEYHKISTGSREIYMGNEASLDVLEIGVVLVFTSALAATELSHHCAADMEPCATGFASVLVGVNLVLAVVIPVHIYSPLSCSDALGVTNSSISSPCSSSPASLS